jgi:hypothetical protein
MRNDLDADFISESTYTGSDVGELVPQEVYSRGGGDCDGGGNIYVYAGDSEDGDEASTGHTRRTGRNVGATDSGGRRRRGICI